MNFSIFPMFYLFHGTYTKISMIFGSIYDFLIKFKHTTKFCINRKKKSTLCRERPQELGPQASLSTLGPRGRCAHALPSLSQTLTGRPHPSVVSSPRTAALPRLRPPLARSKPAPGRASAPPYLRDITVVPYPCSTVSLLLGHAKSGRPPWPTIGRALGLGRA